MCEPLLQLRDRLKSVRILAQINTICKAWIFKRQLNALRRSYSKALLEKGILYSEENAVKTARDAFAKRLKFHDQTKRLNVFWVGANLDQDRSGFLQALEKLCDVTCFYNAMGSYGLWYKNERGRIKVYDPEIIALNDKALLEQVQVAHETNEIDLLIGQMWSNYISSDALKQIQNLGIPTVNVSMDDRLPENWSTKSGYRLGSVGLVEGLDLVLTTTAEVCSWYAVEGCPAIFWPLASDPEVFSPEVGIERDIDVLFIGNRYGIRAKIIDYLLTQGIQVSCWGGGWQNGYATADQCSALFKRAKIILGIGTVGYCDDIYTLKLRDFDAPMSGALYITHRNPDLSELYKEDAEIVCYESAQECADKIRFYLANPLEREALAQKGYSKAIEKYTWECRLKETFDWLFMKDIDV